MYSISGYCVDESTLTEQVVILLFIYITVRSISESFSVITSYKFNKFSPTWRVCLIWLHIRSRHEINFGGPLGGGLRVIFQDSKNYGRIRDPSNFQVRDTLHPLRWLRRGSQRNERPKRDATRAGAMNCRYRQSSEILWTRFHMTAIKQIVLKWQGK